MRLIVASIIAIAFFTQCSSKQEVAQWRGPERNGIYPEKNLMTQWPATGPQLLWKYDSLGKGYSAAVVTSNKVYTIGTIDSISYVFAFNTEGILLWKKKLGVDWTKNWPGIRSTPTIYNGLGYVINGLGVLYCFDAENGNIVWSKDIVKEYKCVFLGYGFCENLVIDGEKLFCTTASTDADVIALDRKSGDLIWKITGSNDSTSYSSPILVQIGENRFFVTQTNKRLISVDIKTGKLAWEYQLKGSPLANTPIYRNGYLFAVDNWKAGSFMLKINDNGYSISEVWRNSNIETQQGDMVLLGDRFYGLAGGDKKEFGCYEWNTGKEIYSDSMKVDIANVISAEGLIYCYQLRGGLVKLLKPKENGFEKLGSFKIKGGTEQLHCSHPVIKDGRLYIRHDNSLFVYDIAKK
ncbi:MAG: PQQ-like beta-propeller repeat protein [Bacteroidales bacterium]|nr:PQQ-like beta-propeller repeat protein [Bacteroidales bacterium]